MEEVTLGKLERGWLRDLWKREDSHFTPWLAREVNIAALAEALELEQLDDVQTEVPVGDFRLDILARDTKSGTLVAIENQFWTGDHKHLGQLLTYAAGVSSFSTEQKLFVWIAEEIKEEHRSALDWLNRVTEPNLGFFGIELELWRIGDSPFAPKFSIVSKPNKWQKELTQESSVHSQNAMQYQEFWLAFIDYCKLHNSTLSLPTPNYHHWLGTYIGKPGFSVNFSARARKLELECQLWIECKQAKIAYAELIQKRDEIVAALGTATEFAEMPSKRPCKIFEIFKGDVANREDWPNIFSWLKERGETYTAFFKPLVQTLKLD